MHRIVLLFAALAFCLPGFANPLCPKHPIRFAHYEFGLIYSSGHGGIDADVQQELQRRSGCAFELSVLPRARIWKNLAEGDLDMAGSGIQTPERDKFAWFAHYLLENNVVILGPKTPKDMHNFDAFLANPNLLLGSVRSYSYSPYYDSIVTRLSKTNRTLQMAEPDNLYRMFEAGRIDAFITSPILYLYYVKQFKQALPARIEDWDPAGPSPSGLVLSKKTFTESQAQQWQSLIEQMLSDGSLLKIVSKYMGTELGPQTVYKASLH